MKTAIVAVAAWITTKTALVTPDGNFSNGPATAKKTVSKKRQKSKRKATSLVQKRLLISKATATVLVQRRLLI